MTVTLFPALLLEAYTTVTAVCRLHEKNYVTPRLLAYPHGMDMNEYKKRVLDSLYAELRPLTGEKHPYILRSRHPPSRISHFVTWSGVRMLRKKISM